MLPPDSRVVLTEELGPEPGFRLDYAVATTFTLDMAAALVAPLAFAAHRLQDQTDPMAVMEAVRASSQRVDVFCQAGNIGVPSTGSGLFAFLEPMIHPLRQPRPGRLFHPKIWLVRYRSAAGNRTTYRMLVLSRNLTADPSWDICLRLDGTPTDRRQPKNKPVADLLRWLPRRTVVPLAQERTDNIEQLAEEARSIVWELPDGVNDVSFYTLGIPGQRRPGFGGTRQLIVSPFCNEAGVDLAAPHPTREATIVSRQEDLDRLPDETVACLRCRVLHPLAGLADVGEQDNGVLVGLHAKLYVVEYDRTARMLIGSANATDAAFGGNVEVLVELTGSKRMLGIDTMMGEDAPFAGLLDTYVRQDPLEADDEDWALEDLLRQLAAVPMTAQVQPHINGGYRLVLRSRASMPFRADHRVTVELVTRLGEARVLTGGSPVDVVFDDLTLVQITPFVIIGVRDPEGKQRSAVMHVVLVDDPKDRLDEILAAQVDTPEKFLRFLALLLGLSSPDVLLAGASAKEGVGGWGVGAMSGVFELVVRALVDQPEALDDLDRLVRRLRSTEAGLSRLPDGFDRLWTVIAEARAALRAEPTS